MFAIFWLTHYRVFGVIERFSRGLANLSLLFLMCIVVLPFATRTLGEYKLPAAAAFYAGCMVATGLTSLAIWIYARRTHLTVPTISPQTVRSYTARGLVTLVLFSVSMVVALFSPLAAQIVWVLTALVTPPLAERGRAGKGVRDAAREQWRYRSMPREKPSVAYAMMSWMTLPETSVRRKSRPLYRYVSFV